MKLPDQIPARLQALATERQIQISYACESGSRAWGMASTDSDYDVRFVYQHPAEHYLKLQSQKDQIGPLMEQDGELDMVGWDIKKFLTHLAGSNAHVREWIHSPIVYFQKDGLLEELRNLSYIYFQAAKISAHYIGVSRSAIKAGLGEDGSWNLKKYCYLMRPLLAADYVVHEQHQAPIYMEALQERIRDTAVRQAVEELLVMKETVAENHRMHIPPLVEQYFDKLYLSLQEQSKQLVPKEINFAPINTFFRKIIGYE